MIENTPEVSWPEWRHHDAEGCIRSNWKKSTSRLQRSREHPGTLFHPSFSVNQSQQRQNQSMINHRENPFVYANTQFVLWQCWDPWGVWWCHGNRAAAEPRRRQACRKARRRLRVSLTAFPSGYRCSTWAARCPSHVLVVATPSWRDWWLGLSFDISSCFPLKCSNWLLRTNQLWPSASALSSSTAQKNPTTTM